MKQWLASFPHSVMMKSLYDRWYEAAEIENVDECVKAMKELVSKLSKMNRFILYVVCDLCRKIVAKTDVNLMTYHNLAIVFVPSLMSVSANEELSVASAKRLGTVEKLFMLSEKVLADVKQELDEAAMQSAAYKEVQAKRKREAVDAIRQKHMREKSVISTTPGMTAQEWAKKRKEELAAREKQEEEEAEARAKKEREEALAREMEEYEARIREQKAREKEEQERKARKEQEEREAEEKAKKEFEEREKKVRELAEKAEKAEQEKLERQKSVMNERKRLFQAAEAKRKAAEAEAEAAAAAAEEYDEDTCAGCGKPVEEDDEDAFEALGGLWHADCYVCQNCKKKLEDDDVKAKKNRPFCKKCYTELFCPVCYGCSKPITGGVLKALDATWHKECFVCAKCGKPITGDFTTNDEGMPVCC